MYTLENCPPKIEILTALAIPQVLPPQLMPRLRTEKCVSHLSDK